MNIRPVPFRLGAERPPLLGSGVRWFRAWVLVTLGALCLVSARGWAQAEKSRLDLPDKARARAKMLERYRSKLEVKDDAEWAIIQARIEAVFKAQHELQSALQATQRRARSSGGKSGKSTAGAADSARVSDEDPGAEVLALQKLVESRAPAQEIKPHLARVRELLRERQEKLNTAREDLRMVLSSRQEAIAVLNGLLR